MVQTFPLKLSMVVIASRFLEFIEFLQLGVRTNWFGLWCPLHCGSSSFASLALFFLLGWISGIASSCIFGFFILRLVHLPPASNPPISLALNRLRGYSI